MNSEFILEIGTEEIPSGYINDALLQLKALMLKTLEDESILFSGEIKTMGTPRRLTLMIRGLSATQRDSSIEIMGPPRNAAYDLEGRPTKAYEGFLKRHKANPEDVVIKDTPKGEYLCIRRVQKGKPTGEVLGQRLPMVLQGISWPKSMRWNEVRVPFARPIHWILALLDGHVIPFEFAGVQSGSYTFGHRFMSPDPITITKIDQYEEALRTAWVMVDHEKRRNSVVTQLQSKIPDKELEVILEEDLLDTVTNLVEWPFVMVGRFDQRFISMPREVLITVMKKHQKYFPVQDKTGKLVPYFMLVNNTNLRNPEVAIKGNERVLKARFVDAEFFYGEDTKKPLLQRLDGLKDVVFHISLGTSYDKVMRFTETAKYLADLINPEVKADVELVCKLSKCDLLTHMVFEFPELQGVIGKHYAKREGYPAHIYNAIEEHYWPLRANDPVSKSDIANCVGMADRIDTIVGFFAINQIPTGNTDPFALRRHALAILRILEERGYKVGLSDLIRYHMDILTRHMSFDWEATFQGVYAFFEDRLRYKLLRVGYAAEMVDAVLGAGIEPFDGVIERLKVLKAHEGEGVVADVVSSFKRVNNILKAQENTSDEISFLTAASEINLLRYMDKKTPVIQDALGKGDYEMALYTLAEAKGLVDALFDEVEIMAKDPQLRAQRLGALLRLRNLYLKWADFSKLSS